METGTKPGQAESWPRTVWPGRPDAGRRAVRTVARALRTVALGADTRPSWLAGRPRGVRWAVIAALVVVTIGLFGMEATVVEHVHPSVGVWAPLVALAQLLPLPLIVRYPLLAWRLGYLGALLIPLVPERPWGTWVWDPVQIPVLGLAFCVAGLRYPRALLWTMWALMVPLLWVWGPGGSDAVGANVAFTVVVVLLDTLAARSRTQRALRVQTDLSEREASRRAALEERARIARELHDVVAHHMSLIAVQAETAPYRHDAVPEPLLEEFSAISGAAREALTEMRRLLGVLRSEQTAAQRAPQPDLGELPELVDAARRAGVRVDLSVRGRAPGDWSGSRRGARRTEPESSIPATVGVCGYRIVQESLSNAGRHAAGAAVEVTVDYAPDAVRLSVVNGPGRAAPPVGPTAAANAGTAANAGPGSAAPSAGAGGRRGGHGLVGMRERVALLGGELSAGPTVEGGFAVRAVLPLEVSE
ncbi:sensor histidine kinase [Rugosimonospora africana]|nr:histidine kinase [Rugosimonospora africana]